MLALLEQHRPAVCVELGTWRGASALAMARVLRPWGGQLFCVDTWTGDLAGAGTVPGRPTMLAECAANLIAAGVAASVRLIPARTDEAAAHWQGPIACLYVDADHTQAAVTADLEAWWPHVAEGGLVAGDDYDNPLYPGVTAAWDRFEREHDQTFTRVATPQTTPPGMRLVYGVKR